jgi:hypothetical protein
MGRERADFYITKNAEIEANRALAEAAYHATNPDYDEGPAEAERQLLEGEIERELLQNYERGVCCFSEDFKSSLLWSHYGDQHRGICIGYTADRRPSPRPERVSYGGGRIIKTSQLVSAILNDEPKATRRLDRNVLLRKSRDWSYECEWRLIGSSGVQNSPLLMTEVVFGLRCPGAVQHTVVQALRDRDAAPITFFEIYQVPRRYTLRRRPLELGELGACYPKVAMSGHEMFSPVEPEGESRRP